MSDHDLAEENDYPELTSTPVQTTRTWLFMAMGVGALGAILLTLLIVL